MAATIDVNVADQAYPPPPGGSQAIPVPSAVAVASLLNILPSLSQGTSAVDPPDVDVAVQNSVIPPVEEWLVTESGNVQTNNTRGDIETFTVSSVVTLSNPTRFQVFFTVSTLNNLGVSLVGLNALFPNQAPASAPENAPVRPIQAFSDNYIIVAETNPISRTTMTSPSGGNTVQIAVVRDGSAVINDTDVPDDVDVIVNPSPPVATTISAPALTNLGNIQASSGVVSPFVGSGQSGPPFIGTFEVENQTFGTGLPRNVFVG